MTCKYCKKEIEDDSVFCRHCGERVQRRRKQKTEVSVPAPTETPSNKWRGRLMVNGQRVYVTEDSEDAYYIRARAVKAGMIEKAKSAQGLTLGAVIDKFISDKEAVLSPSTVRSYLSMRKNRFSGYMDADCGRIQYQVMISQETKKTSAKTVRNAWRLVSAALKYAKIEYDEPTLPKSAPTARKEKGSGNWRSCGRRQKSGQISLKKPGLQS